MCSEEKTVFFAKDDNKRARHTEREKEIVSPEKML